MIDKFWEWVNDLASLMTVCTTVGMLIRKMKKALSKLNNKKH